MLHLQRSRREQCCASLAATHRPGCCNRVYGVQMQGVKMGAKSVLPFKGNLKESSSQSHHGDKNCMTDSDEGWFFVKMQQNVSGLATFPLQ